MMGLILNITTFVFLVFQLTCAVGLQNSTIFLTIIKNSNLVIIFYTLLCIVKTLIQSDIVKLLNAIQK